MTLRVPRFPQGRNDTLQVLLSIIVISLFLGAVFWQSSSQASPRVDPLPPRGVAVIDELSATYPNPAFVENVRRMVERAGYWLDYYPPRAVVVPLFWALPALGYELVIIRAHSTGWVAGDKVTIFTGEEYQKGKYYWEQVRGYVSSATTFESSRPYFTVTPKLIMKLSQGQFPGTVVVMMGCTGLVNGQMATAFEGKGADAYVGWKGQVYASRTDSATLHFMDGLLQQHMTLSEAVAYAMSQVGEDPLFNSELGLYPSSAGTLQITA